MNKTKIPWCDYTINQVKGLCPMACEYCYARRMHKRFKWNPEIRYEDSFYEFYALRNKPHSKVFIGSTIELFGDWIRREWIHNILGFCHAYSQHTFIFLTKQPQNLIKFSPFPDNCYVGSSVINMDAWISAIYGLERIQASVKFISFEPLLERIIFKGEDIERILDGISWVIIGSQTQPTKHPRKEWVDEIMCACDKAGIPVFIKEPLASHMGIQRQEFPG